MIDAAEAANKAEGHRSDLINYSPTHKQQRFYHFNGNILLIYVKRFCLEKRLGIFLKYERIRYLIKLLDQ